MTPLLIAGTLLLSPANPVEVAKLSPKVWLSSAKIGEITPLASGGILRAKDEGLFFVSGLSGLGNPQRVLSIDDESFVALKRCPRFPLTLSQAPMRLSVSPSPALMKEAKDCGFRRLALPERVEADSAAGLELAQAKLIEHGFRPEKIEAHDGSRILTLPGLTSGRRHEAHEILGVWSPFFELTAVTAPRPGRTLVFEVTFFEFSRSRARSMGIRWPQSLVLRPFEGGAVNATLEGVGTGVEMGADFGESLGVGRVLARPRIRAKPGQKASFLSGGELPVRNFSQYHSDTTWKSYGLILELDTDANVSTGAGEIGLSLKLELSEPDASTAIDGVPGMLVKKLENKLDLRTGETTVLTTMIQTRVGEGRSGLPGLSSIPLFGRNTEFSKDAELWIAVKPVWEGAGG